MKFGEDKYTVMRAEKGKVINSDTPLKLIIKEETYKYLGQEENIIYSGLVNKKRV